MADPTQETKPTTPAPSGTAEQTTPVQSGQSEPTSKPDGQQGDLVTLTPSQLKERLEREREKFKKEFEAEQAEAKRQAELSAEEKAKELEKKLSDQQKDFAAKEARLERKSKLLGKVSNAERVLALIELDGKADEFFSGNEPNVEAILKAFPEYATTEPGPDESTGAGGKLPSKLTKEQIQKMSQKEINDRWEEVQQVLKEG